MAGHDGLALPVLHADGLARVVVFGRCVGLPLPDGSAAGIGMAFVPDDSPFGEALGNGVTIAFVRSEIGGDRRRQIKRHQGFLSLHEAAARRAQRHCVRETMSLSLLDDKNARKSKVLTFK